MIMIVCVCHETKKSENHRFGISFAVAGGLTH